MELQAKGWFRFVCYSGKDVYKRQELERYAKDKGYEVAAAVAADGISGVHTEGIMTVSYTHLDTRGHVESKCKKCGRITVFDVLNMRRLRPRTK